MIRHEISICARGACSSARRLPWLRSNLKSLSSFSSRRPLPRPRVDDRRERDGLVAAWFGGTDEGADDVGIWLSRRDGGAGRRRSRSPPAYSQTANGFPWNPVLFEAQGSAAAVLQGRAEPSRLVGHGGPSDGGRTWSARDGCRTASSDRSRTSPCGWRTEQSSREAAPKRPRPEHLARAFRAIGDGGSTWSGSRPPARPGAPIDAIQPSILLHAGGRLQALGRTRGGACSRHRRRRGQTWTPVALTSLPNQNAGTDAVTLRDGRHLIVYNHTQGRSPLNVAVSRDGVKWDGGTRARARARRVFLSSYHSDGRRPRPRHLHLEAGAHQARRDRSGEVEKQSVEPGGQQWPNS